MDSQVEEIKAKIHIVDLVGQYVKLERAGKNYHARCPFHKERTPSFTVSPERNTYMCFGCGEKGDIFSFIEKIEGVDFKAALEELANKAGVVLERRARQTPDHTDKDIHLREVCEAATIFFEKELEKRQDVLRYIQTRGVSDETRKAWRLGYAPASWQNMSEYLQSVGFTREIIVEAGMSAQSTRKPNEIYDRFRGRIMFPLFDVQGRVIAFSGRFFEDIQSESQKNSTETRAEPAKYVNSPETLLFKKSRVMYGLDRAKTAIRRADCILLVEGQFDVVLSHQSGLPFAVALSGTALTPEHLTLMSRYSRRLILALDGDAAGVRSGLRSAHMALQAGFDVKIPKFLDGKDPADIAKDNPELLKAAIRTSKTAVEFFLEAFRSDAKDDRTYKKIIEAQVLPLIAVMPSKIEQEHFISLVAQKLNVPEAAVREEIGKRKSLQPQEEISETAIKPQELQLSAIEKKAAMLLFSFSSGTVEYDLLSELWGTEELQALHERLKDEAESWRFRFEAELFEHSKEVIAKDMLRDIERSVAKRRFKMKFL